MGWVEVAQTATLPNKAGDVLHMHTRLLQTWKNLGSTWLLVQEHEEKIPLNWMSVVSQEGGFAVSMPDTPRELVQPLKTVDGPKEAHLLAAQTEDGLQDWTILCRQRVARR